MKSGQKIPVGILPLPLSVWAGRVWVWVGAGGGPGALSVAAWWVKLLCGNFSLVAAVPRSELYN